VICRIHGSIPRNLTAQDDVFSLSEGFQLDIQKLRPVIRHSLVTEVCPSIQSVQTRCIVMRFTLTSVDVSRLQDDYIMIFISLPSDDFGPGPSFGDHGLNPTEDYRDVGRFILVILNQFFWFRTAFIERQDHLVMVWLPKQIEVNHKQLIGFQ
jgi:hypothetical protein